MILRLKKSVAFVGMMGAGKTAVGRAVAEKLNAPFLDSDHEIEQAANMSVAEIFARDGEAFFRDREAQVIRRLFENEICILSTGGGAFMSQEVREIMTHSGMSLWINADLDLLWSRVKNKDTRPLLQTARRLPLGFQISSSLRPPLFRLFVCYSTITWACQRSGPGAAQGTRRKAPRMRKPSVF